jgi:hypothetical protein
LRNVPATEARLSILGLSAGNRQELQHSSILTPYNTCWKIWEIGELKERKKNYYTSKVA